MEESIWITTENPAILFENTSVGRLKKEVWDASEEEIDQILADYGIPSEPELGKPGSYIQTTVRQRLIENRRKNDIVIVPIGSTENHGRHTCSGLDTFMVTQIAEGVRRFSERGGSPVTLALPPINYGTHPYHHVGMPGTYVIQENTAKAFLMDVMLGLYNDGFRKQVIVNNHGQLWMLESTIQDFTKKYQLPGIFRVMDWHRSVREFFYTKERGGAFDTPLPMLTRRRHPWGF